jgi:hypothetical protein
MSRLNIASKMIVPLCGPVETRLFTFIWHAVSAKHAYHLPAPGATMDLRRKFRSPGAVSCTQGELYSSFRTTRVPLASVPISEPFLNCAMVVTQQEPGIAVDHVLHSVGLRSKATSSFDP